ncbi:hypothetical protein BH11PLA2_BH11PLA2_35580 [soil metagenome]
MRILAAFIVLVASVLTVLAVWRRSATANVRDAVLIAATIVGAYIAVTSEVLSLFAALRFQSVLIAWGVLTFTSLILIAMPGRAWPTLAKPNWYWLEAVPMLVVGAVLAITFVTVLLCPPNNWDVILYHLPRQVQWLQQQSVAHFPTQDYRLTVNPPFAEFAGLHLMILGGTDRLNAAVSWTAFALTLLAVSVMTRDLGVSRTGQWLSAAFAATVPMNIHEAVSGKNDGMVAFWLVCSVIQALRIWNAERITVNAAGLFGLTIGLLILTKGTGGVFAMPVVILLGIHFLKLLFKKSEGETPVADVPGSHGVWSAIAVITGCVVALNASHWHRNHAAYGSITGRTFGLGNEVHSGPAIASNLLRNAAMHLASPREKWNNSIEKFVAKQHIALGISVNEKATTWGGTAFELEHAPQREQAASPIHVLMLLVALSGTLPWLRSVSKGWWLLAFILGGGFLAFCIVFKWQPWHTRLHLPLFALASVIVGAVLCRKEIAFASPVAVMALFGSCLPALVSSEYRSLTDHDGLNIRQHTSESLRYLGHDPIRIAAELITAKVHGRVALINHGALPWEYPLTRHLKSGYSPHVGYFYPVKGSPPSEASDFVIAIGDSRGPEWIRQPHSSRTYRVMAFESPFTLYAPAEALPGVSIDHAVGRFGIGAEQPNHD